MKYFPKLMENKIISSQIKLMLHVECHFINPKVSSGLIPVMSNNRSLQGEFPGREGSQPSWKWKVVVVILHPVFGC